MSNNDIHPKTHFSLAANEQIKAYVHPTRMILLRLLGREKRTISSVAKELGVHPANITHHFKLLEKVGLISLVEKRDTGKNLEKYYRAVAYAFEVAPKENSTANKKAIALSILKNNLATAINTIKDNDTRETAAYLATAKISAAQIAKFTAKLEKLIQDFKCFDSQEGNSYTINIGLYPNETGPVDHSFNQEIRLE
jgi:DNA-binding transcriptional ArsR family regulator